MSECMVVEVVLIQGIMDSDSSADGNVALSSDDEGPSEQHKWATHARTRARNGTHNEDDEQERMAFTEDTDFVGGTWIDGEFYYEQQKQKKPKMSKEEAIYGVFAEGDSSSEEQTMDDRIATRMGGRRSGRKKHASRRTTAAAAATTGMSFVKGRNEQKEEEEPNDAPMQDGYQQAGGSGSNESSRSGLGSSGSRGLGHPSSSQQQSFSSLLRGATGTKGEEKEGRGTTEETLDDSDRKKYKKPPPRVKDLGKFEKHTKGFGMKYLSKFGFKGRLGKYEQGVAQPVAVQVRPDRRGISYGNFKEDTQLKENREIAQDYFGEEFVEAEKKKQYKVPQDWKRQAEAPGQLSAKKKQPRKTYKTAADVLQGSSQSSAASQVIVDMRGPQKKVLTDMSQVNEDETEAPETTGEEVSKVGEELRHNLSLLADTTQVQLQQLHREIARNEHKSNSLDHDIVVLERKIQNREEEMHSVNEIVRKLEQYTLEQNDLASMLEKAHSLFDELIRSKNEEFKLHNLVELGPAMVEHCFENANSSEDDSAWNLLSDEQVLQPLKKWVKTVSEHFGNPQEGKDEVSKLKSSIGYYIMPTLRKSLQVWSPYESENAVCILRQLKPLISPESFTEVLQELIFPRIKHTVENWNPRTDSVPIDSWLLLWREVLPNELETLYPTIRQKFSKELVNWEPSDTSAKLVLERWVGVWSYKAMNSLLLRSIMPKLVTTMRELEISPAAQEMDKWKQVMDWFQMMPRFNFICLLEGEFFPKWLSALYQWLWSVEEVNLEEVASWYKGWKRRLPEELLEEPRIRKYLDVALNMMDRYMSSNQIPSPSEFILSNLASYYDVLRCHQIRSSQNTEEDTDDEKSERPSEFAAARQSRPEVDQKVSLSFKEVVTHVAAERGVEFVPNLKRGKVDGKQVYKLTGSMRSLNVYLVNDIIYYEKQQGNFEATDIDEVMHMVNGRA